MEKDNDIEDITGAPHDSDVEDITGKGGDVEDITPHKQGWGEYIGRGVTGTLPYVGAAGAAVPGFTAGGPLGSVGAGAMGYAGGKEAERLLNHYLFGDSPEEDYNKPLNLSPMEKLKRVAGNAREGAEQEMGGAVTSNLLSRAVNPLARKAEDFAIKHLRPTPKVAQVLGKEKLRDVGREALDSGAIGFLKKAETTGARLGDLKDESGSVIGDLVEGSDSTINPVEIATKFEDEVIAPLRKTSGNDALIKKLEGQKQDFLDKYAPGHIPGGRDSSLPTTVTRKSQFIPQQSKTDYASGIKQIGEKRTPRPYLGEDEIDAIKGYLTPEKGEPFSTDIRTGLPVKRISQKRIEANPAPKPMTAAQVEAQKRVEQQRVNWLTDPKLNAKAQMGWSGVLKDTGEKMIDDPAFNAAKRAYGNQSLAEGMANHTSALTNGGTGLFGHMSDLGVNLEALQMLAHGNPAGVPLAVGRGLIKGRVSSALAKAMDAASKTAGSTSVQKGANVLSRPVWDRMLEQEQR